MAFCSKCGKPVDENDVFCAACGHRLNGKSNDDAAEKAAVSNADPVIEISCDARNPRGGLTVLPVAEWDFEKNLKPGDRSSFVYKPGVYNLEYIVNRGHDPFVGRRISKYRQYLKLHPGERIDMIVEIGNAKTTVRFNSNLGYPIK